MEQGRKPVLPKSCWVLCRLWFCEIVLSLYINSAPIIETGKLRL